MPKAKLDATAADDAIRLLEAGDWNGGLAALNALWATNHDRDLAAEIERLSAHASKSSPTVGADQQAWEKACATGNLVGLEHLLTVIREGTAPNMRARFDRLLERDPDPRMTMLVPLFANELHLRSEQARAVWTAFFKLVVHTGDPRAATGLKKLAALAQKTKRDAFAQYLVKQIAKVIDELPEPGTYAGLPALKKQVVVVLEKPVTVARKKASSGDSLYANVLAEIPSDLAARQVWADALLEAGDDRGTFVALQLATENRALTPSEQKQHDQLLAANRTTWLGDAGAAIEVKTATFRRGVLDSAVLSKKTRPKDLEAREFRTVAQLGARSPELLAHPNLVSLTRIGRGFVPNPHSQTGLVGFDRTDGYGFDGEEVEMLANQHHGRITHLEMGLPEDCNVDVVKRAFPDLDTVSIGYAWSATKKAKTFEVLIPWLRGMRDVILDDLLYSNESEDGWFVDRLPTSNVHVVFGGGEVYRSYIRRDGKVHAVFTDTSTKPGFSDNGQRAKNPAWMRARMGFFQHMPEVESLTFRQRATWLQVDVDAVAAATKNMKNVTLPRAKK